MRIFRTILSIVALAVAAVGVAQATGALTWNAAVVDLVTAGGGILAVFGVTPIALPVMAARACAAVASFCTLVVGAHASGAIPGGPRLFNMIAVGAVLVGAMGKFQAPPADAPPPPRP